jgi:hypothetical protein
MAGLDGPPGPAVVSVTYKNATRAKPADAETYVSLRGEKRRPARTRFAFSQDLPSTSEAVVLTLGSGKEQPPSKERHL